MNIIEEPSFTNLLYKCHVCQEEFDQYALEVHFLNNHNTEKEDQIRRKCEICEKTFSKLYILTKHINVVHGEREQIKCEICDKYFTEAGHLRSHLKVHDEAKKNFLVKNVLRVLRQKVT